MAAKQYIQIKPEYIGVYGEQYAKRSFLVTNRQDGVVAIRRDTVWLDTAHVIFCHEQAFNLEAGTLFASLPLNITALSRVIPSALRGQEQAQVVDMCVENGQLFVWFGDDFDDFDDAEDDEKTEEWVHAHKLVFSYRPLELNKAFYQRKFDLQERNNKFIKSKFEDGYNNNHAIFYNELRLPNGDVHQGYSIWSFTGEKFITAYNRFASVEEAKQFNIGV
jgi:hypothetical protein